MKEILFRGKTARKGEWIEGYYCPCVLGGFPADACIISKERLDNGCWTPDRIIPESIGRFTGLFDKYQKKIFEGDRVKVTYIEKRKYQGVSYDDEHCLTEEVFYSEENACFMLKVMCDDIPMYRPLHNFESLAKIKEIEVIGNIYDNPELLEVENA